MRERKNRVVKSPSDDHIYSTIYSVLENIISEKSEREHRKLKNNHESGAVQYTSGGNNAVFGNNAVSVLARPITEIIIIRIYF
jgi:hypothetical protein